MKALKGKKPKHLVFAQQGLLEDSTWKSALKGYPTELVCRIRRELSSKIRGLNEKFNRRSRYFDLSPKLKRRAIKGSCSTLNAINVNGVAARFWLSTSLKGLHHVSLRPTVTHVNFIYCPKTHSWTRIMHG